MSDKLEVRRGEKIEDQAEAKASKELGILISLAPDGVEGQYFYNGLTQCPYCGNIGFTQALNSEVYINVVCGRCGLTFRA